MKKALEVIGLKVTDKITKTEGVIINYAEYLHQGARVDVQPTKNKTDGTIHDSFSFDIIQLEISKKRVLTAEPFIKTDVNISDEVKDKITGYKGIVVGKCWHMNGCISLLVQEKYDPKMEKEYSRGKWIAASNLEIIKPAKVEYEPKKNGGPGERNQERTKNC